MKKRQSKLLLDEFPLLVLPKLAVKVGLNEAIILQQVNYWIVQCGKERNGREWVFNTYPDWQKQFPFFSLSTIKRTILSLEKMGLLITGNYNRLKIDKTKWYTIDFDALDALDTPIVQNDTTDKTPLAQNGLSNGSNCTIEETNLSRPLPETTLKTNTNTNNVMRHDLNNDVARVVDNFSNDGQTVYDYFIDKYFIATGSKHPSINQSVVDKINSIFEDEYITDPESNRELSINIGAMCDMIDWYFDNNNPLYGDRKIYHFLSPMILKNLYNKVAR